MSFRIATTSNAQSLISCSTSSFDRSVMGPSPRDGNDTSTMDRTLTDVGLADLRSQRRPLDSQVPHGAGRSLPRVPEPRGSVARRGPRPTGPRRARPAAAGHQGTLMWAPSVKPRVPTYGAAHATRLRG